MKLKKYADLGGWAKLSSLFVGSALCASLISPQNVSAAGLSSLNYVQDGLVTHFDSLENTGRGTYSDTATTWTDLKGSASIALRSSASWAQRYLDTGGDSHVMQSMPGVAKNSLTLEVPIRVIENKASNSNYPMIAGVWNSFYLYFYAAQNTLRLSPLSNSNFPAVSGQRAGTVFARSDSEKCYYHIDYNGNAFSWYVNFSGGPLSGSIGAGNWYLNGGYGYLHGHYYGLRLYNRPLTTTELDRNFVVDRLRYFSYLHSASGAANWSDIAWTVPETTTATAPSTSTNAYVQIKGATVNVTAADKVGLMGLSLEDGAKLDIADGAVAAVKVLYVEGHQIARGFYTGTGSGAVQVDWLSGNGILRVAGSRSGTFPSVFPTPAADGWYEFGLEGDGATGTDTYIVGDHPDWSIYAFPTNSKLRLVGSILLETVPAGFFSQYDTSRLTFAYLHGSSAFADGTTLVVPSGCVFRYMPGTWTTDGSTPNKYNASNVTVSEVTYAGGVENNGTIYVSGEAVSNVKQSPRQRMSGHLSGSGAFYLPNWGHQLRISGGYSGTNSFSGYMSQGGCLWFDTLSMTGRLATANMPSCNGYYQNANYCAAAILFGKYQSGETADHELYIETVNGNAGVNSGWRNGCNLIVWGGNTIHVGRLTSSTHVIGRPKDQKCTLNYLGMDSSVGVGNVVIDEIAGGGVYASTNVNVKVGTVSNACTFDYSLQSGAVNRMKLDITNTCNTSAVVKAKDLAMLPARISGFAGKVNLVDSETRTYAVAMDFSQGTNAIYNVGGCIGSGTLNSAPSGGTIDVTFPKTGYNAVYGDYAVARFSSGGALLSGWNVTINGQAVARQRALRAMVTVVKDGTGIWLRVRKPGMLIIVE